MIKKLAVAASIVCFFVVGSVSCTRSEACRNGLNVSVVTYNIGDIFGHRQDPEFIAQIIRTMDTPDVVFLQEVPSAEYVTELVKALSDDVQYTGVYSRPTLAAILTVYQVQAVQKATYPHSSSSYGGLIAEVDVWGEHVLLCNVHLKPIRKTRDNSGFVDMTFREATSILWQEVFRETDRTEVFDHVLGQIEKRTPMNVILAGDFNTVPLSKTARAARKQYTDALRYRKGYVQGTYKKIRTIVPTRVDYIYISNSFSVKEGKVLKETPGDHYPITAELCLNLEI